MNSRNPNRREFLRASSSLAAGYWLSGLMKEPVNSYGIAYTSFMLQLRRARSTAQPFPADQLLKICRDLKAGGCQMDIAQLTNGDPEYLKKLRQSAGFIELSVNAGVLEDEAAFAKVAATAGALGVSRLRVACLSGRRYENFDDLTSWRAFADRWKKALRSAEPLLKKHKVLVGIENHKDWTMDELAEILNGIGSPYLGVCLDFGNNMSLLEDPLETAEKLAPFVVTTHLKDMAVRSYDEGFELSEVPLGKGILPLAQLVAMLRKHRKDVNFCLEMITRDPLLVPYKTDRYWVTHDRKDENRMALFERRILSRSSSEPLPRISGLSVQEALTTERQNVIDCSDYALNVLKLKTE